MPRIKSRPKGRRRVTPAERGEDGSRGRGCHPRSRAAPGQNARPALRPACGDEEPRCTGTAGVGNAHPYLVPAQEARELELSGGVRSLPQVPWWNAGRRARPRAEGRRKPPSPWRAAVPAGTASVNSATAGVPLPLFLSSLRAKRSNPVRRYVLDCLVAEPIIGPATSGRTCWLLAMTTGSVGCLTTLAQRTAARE